MLTLVPRNIIQTSTQLQEEQDRLFEEAKQKNENRKEQIKATFKSTFARKVSDESVIEGINMTSVDPSTPTLNADKMSTEQTNNNLDGTNDSNLTATVDTSMPLVDALRKHFASLIFIAVLFFSSRAFAQIHQFEVTIKPDPEYIVGTDFNLLLQAGTHSVDLSWVASPDGGASKVYRATAACSTNPTFTNIATTAVGAITYIDTPVSIGTYCYQVTAFVNALESVPSNSAPAVVLPSPDTSLTAVPK